MARVNSLEACHAVMFDWFVELPMRWKELIGHLIPQRFFLQRVASELPSLPLGPRKARLLAIRIPTGSTVVTTKL